MGGSRLWRTSLYQGILEELSLFFFLFFLLLLIKTKVASYLRFLGSLYSPFGALVTGMYSLHLLFFFFFSSSPPFHPPFNSSGCSFFSFFFLFFPFFLSLFSCFSSAVVFFNLPRQFSFFRARPKQSTFVLPPLTSSHHPIALQKRVRKKKNMKTKIKKKERENSTQLVVYYTSMTRRKGFSS